MPEWVLTKRRIIMYLKKFLNQPNAVGSVLIALLFSAGILFAFGFGGFNVQSVGEDGVNSLFQMAASECCGGDKDCDCIGSTGCGCATYHACGNKTSSDVCKDGCNCNADGGMCCNGIRCESDSKCKDKPC